MKLGVKIYQGVGETEYNLLKSVYYPINPSSFKNLKNHNLVHLINGAYNGYDFVFVWSRLARLKLNTDDRLLILNRHTEKKGFVNALTFSVYGREDDVHKEFGELVGWKGSISRDVHILVNKKDYKLPNNVFEYIKNIIGAKFLSNSRLTKWNYTNNPINGDDSKKVERIIDVHKKTYSNSIPEKNYLSI